MGWSSAAHASCVNLRRRWSACPAVRALGSKQSQPSEGESGIEEGSEIVAPEFAEPVQRAALGTAESCLRSGCSKEQKIELHLDRRPISVRGGLVSKHPVELTVEGMLGVQGDDELVVGDREVVEQGVLES